MQPHFLFLFCPCSGFYKVFEDLVICSFLKAYNDLAVKLILYRRGIAKDGGEDENTCSILILLIICLSLRFG